MKPSFFVVGAQKAGTTALHHFLSEHPDIYLPRQKETKFFVDNSEYEKGISYYLETYFSDCPQGSIAGEVDPDYMYFSKAADRIYKHITAPKFIFIFRNPVERAFSHYIMSFRRGLELFTFEEAIEKERSRIEVGYEGDFHYSYVKRGSYYGQVNRFLLMFKSSEMLYLLSDDLKNKPVETVQQCYKFLGVDDKFIPNIIERKFHEATVPKVLPLSILFRDKSAYPLIRKVVRNMLPSLELRNKIRAYLVSWNSKKNDLKLKESTRLYLIDLYKDDNKKLSQLINRDISHWN